VLFATPPNPTKPLDTALSKALIAEPKLSLIALPIDSSSFSLLT
jgi:hypothetical protein